MAAIIALLCMFTSIKSVLWESVVQFFCEQQCDAMKVNHHIIFLGLKSHLHFHIFYVPSHLK